MKLVDANPNPEISGADQLPNKSNYFIGNDPKRWRTGIANYAKVHYKEVYPGIDLTYYGSEGKHEYDFILSPGADPRIITLRFENLDGAMHRLPLQVDARGDLALGSSALYLGKPEVYQQIDGVRHAINGRYVVRGEGEVGFEVAEYDTGRALIIDPLVLTYSTYLGGSGSDASGGIAVDNGGNAYVTGSTSSADFPTASPTQSANGGGSFDVFVAKLNAAGSALVYSTYLGGNGSDESRGIAVDASGNAYVTGGTASTNFPMASPLQGANSGGGLDIFVAKLNAAGALVYSTYLGGSDGPEEGRGIAVDASGNAYVTGITTSSNFPTANPLQARRNNFTQDAFVAKLSATGSTLVYSTFFGGNRSDSGSGIAVDTIGNAYITGATNSPAFPTANPLQATLASTGGDAFVAKLNAAGSALVYSTYLGGSVGDKFLFAFDWGIAIAVDASGNAYVTGETTSTDFPTANPLQAAFGGGVYDAFVAKQNPAGSALVYSTYLGGSRDESGYGIAVDASGNAYAAGLTESTNFPTASPLQSATGGGADLFVAKLNAAGSALVYSTYLGGSGSDSGRIAVDTSGNAYVAGSTNSTNFPTASPLQAALAGGGDVFVTKIVISRTRRRP